MPLSFLRLLLLFCLIFPSSVFAEESYDDWIEPTSETIQALRDAFVFFIPGKDDSDVLSDYVISLSVLKGPMEKCVDVNTQQLEKYATDIGAFDDSSTSRSSRTDQSLKEMEQRRSKLESEMLTCRAMLLEIESLSDTIRKKQQAILADYLLAKDPDFIQVIVSNVTHMGEWLSTMQSFLKNRAQLQTMSIKDWLLFAVLLFVGGYIGKMLRSPVEALTRSLTAKEVTTQLLLSLSLNLIRMLPYLLAAVGAMAGLLLAMETWPLPPSMALLIAFISYLLVSSVVSAILTPKPPLEMFVRISADGGQHIYRRLHSLLLIGLIVLLAYEIELHDAMTEDQWRISSSVLLLLATLNLIWLVSLLNRVPGVLGNALLRGLIIVILLASVVAEVIGYRNLSLHLFQGVVGSALLAIALWLVNALLTDIFDGLDEGHHRWQQAIRRKLRLNRDEPIPGLLWLRLITLLVTWTVLIISVVQLWGYNAVSWTMLSQQITDGFNVAGFRVEPLKLVFAVVVFSLLITFVRWFKQETLPGWVKRTRLDRGAREAIISISGYVGIIIAAILGLSLAGFSFTNIAIVAGALSVGIGFGLQNIVNNFISGIILLFERPIRTGDWIVVGNTEGYVRKISIRSTQIETFDRADVIVPNSELISNQVTNWMLRDPWGRVIVPVGVSYDSDEEQVRDILLKVASENELVLTDEIRVSPPKVLFRGFCHQKSFTRSEYRNPIPAT
jgi:small-conductance mechanosensitive channel